MASKGGLGHEVRTRAEDTSRKAAKEKGYGTFFCVTVEANNSPHALQSPLSSQDECHTW